MFRIKNQDDGLMLSDMVKNATLKMWPVDIPGKDKRK
jgi:hypothetical protein